MQPPRASRPGLVALAAIGQLLVTVSQGVCFLGADWSNGKRENE
jgi:hypothetical protein